MDRPIEQKKGLKKKHLPYIILGLLFLILVGWLLFGDHSSSMRVNARNVIISTVEEGTFNDYIRLNGQVQPKTSVQLSALEGGRVEQILAVEGAIVKAGDVLLVLRNPDLLQQTRDKEVQYAEQQNSMLDNEISIEKEKLSMLQTKQSSMIDAGRAKRAYEQQSALYDEGLTTRESYLRAKEDYELSESQLRLLEKRLYQDSLNLNLKRLKMRQSLDNMYRNLQLARQRVDDLNVKATYDGQLASFNLQLGQQVSAGSMIGQINILGEYKIQVSIDERYIDRVVAGLVGTLERQGVEYNVVVSTVYPDVKDGQFRADITFGDEVPENIRVGQTYYINLQLGEPAVTLLVQRGSFFSSTGGKWVYVVSPDGGTATKRNIKIGRQNPQSYEIIEGLQAGERIITSGYDNFGDNERLILSY